MVHFKVEFCSVDEKAFDRIYHEQLMKRLKSKENDTLDTK